MESPIDSYFSKPTKWQEELQQLRSIVLSCQLREEFKWSTPCYCHQANNIVLIGSFKDYCTLSFFKGVLLLDEAKILEKPGPNSQSSRLIRFRSVEEINAKEELLRQYIYEAIEIENAGQKVNRITSDETENVPELIEMLNANEELNKAFNALTPGRKRGYIIYFSGAKHSKSRYSRIEKYIPRILDGKGFHDCVCGLTKKPPSCDGSHKFISKEN